MAKVALLLIIGWAIGFAACSMFLQYRAKRIEDTKKEGQ